MDGNPEPVRKANHREEYDVWHEIVIHSRLEEMPLVLNPILKLAETAGYDEAQRHKLKLCLDEAVTNAIIHGNNSEENKTVRVIYKYELPRKTIIVTIEDEGKGFVVENVPDPLADENLAKHSGRGIFIMRTLMDEVTYNKKGNVVTLVFKKRPGGL